MSREDEQLSATIDHGITIEEHLLYLASADSHTRLRNAKLPRAVGMNMVRVLVNRGYLTEHSVPRDAHGSIVEYLLSHRGAARLEELRSARAG